MPPMLTWISMSAVDGADLDPEVWADPLEPDRDPEHPAEETPTGAARASTQLVPSKGTSLVPADPFRRYLAEIRRYPRLDRDEERELARRYRVEVPFVC